MKLSITDSCAEGYKTDKYKFQYIKDCGFDACDFHISCVSHAPASDEEMKAKCLEIKAAADAAGVEIYQTHGAGGGRWSEEKEQEMIDTMIRDIKCTHWVGSKYCIIHPAILITRRYERNKEESIEIALRVYAALKDTLEKYDVYCCLENMWNDDPIFKHICPTICSRAKEMVDMCDILGDRYKICVDTGHGELTQDDPVEMIRICGDKLAALHCHDTDSKSDLHTFPFTPHKINKHAVRNDWLEMMKALKEVGYKGTLSFEVVVPGPDELNKAGLECLAAMGRYFVASVEGE